MTNLRLAALAAVVCLAVALSGCGSSSSSTSTEPNGMATKSAAEILAAMTAAVKDQTSVHVVAVAAPTATSPRTTVDASAEVDKGGTFHGTTAGATFDVIRDGDDLYFRGSKAFWELSTSTKDFATTLADHWLKVSATGAYAVYAQFVDKSKLLDHYLGSPGGTPTKGAVTTIDGQPVITLKSPAGTLSVATTGDPLPVKLVTADGKTATFSEWNESVDISAPDDAVNPADLIGP